MNSLKGTKTAEIEGFPAISMIFKKIGEVETRHELRYRKLLSNLENNEIFNKVKPSLWKCINCGYIFEGTSAPQICPACAHPQDYFELFTENY